MTDYSADLLTVEIISTDFSALLRLLGSYGIPIFHLRDAGILTVRAEVKRSDYPQLVELLEHRGERIRIRGYRGAGFTIRAILARPVLMFGVFVLVLISCLLPSRILFVAVEGNDTIPSRLILEQAQQCGIGFGARRREVRSERMKNSLVAAIDQLQWAGINTYGCTAVITVKERAGAEEINTDQGVSSIVAVRDGVVLSSTVTRGNAMCQVGAAVKEGEVLISGYTDCGIKIQATRAEGEVIAQTVRELTVLEPAEYVRKTSPCVVQKYYSVQIGKKRINFYKDSGISGTTCDKIRNEYVVELHGGFHLPVKLIEETYIWYEEEPLSLDLESDESVLREYVRTYLRSQMIAGTILQRTESVTAASGVNCLQGRYICQEMIGRVQREEIWDNYGTND